MGRVIKVNFKKDFVDDLANAAHEHGMKEDEFIQACYQTINKLALIASEQADKCYLQEIHNNVSTLKKVVDGLVHA